jgi:uncharacterized membrane protein (DUF373 family)
MMTVVLVFATLDLGWILIRDLLFHEPRFLLSVEDLLDLFGLFMLVLIGIELLETVVKSYLKQKAVHLEVVLSVAIIALARKIIITDIKDLSAAALAGIAALVLALCVGYYLLGRTRLENIRSKKRKPPTGEAPGI